MRRLVTVLGIGAAAALSCSPDDDVRSSANGGAGALGTAGGSAAATAGNSAGASAGGSGYGGGGASGGGAGAGGGLGVDCPAFDVPVAVGQVQSSEVDEASGLAVSRRNPGVLWTHNDRGGTGRLFAVTTLGETVAVADVATIAATDWEDLSIGPGPEPDQHYLYIADIGDNSQTRSDIVVYRVREPVLSEGVEPQELTLADVEALHLIYPGGEKHNAESLLVDPLSADLYVITKLASGTTRVFRAAAPRSTELPAPLTLVATLNFVEEPLAGAQVTAADISASGDAILVRTYATAYWWPRGANVSIGDALVAQPCVAIIPWQEQQGEAIAFDTDGASYYTLSEGSAPFIYRISRR
jgi:hypothetical protein